MTKKKKGGRQQRAANANAAKEKEAAETKQKADAAAARAAAAAAAADDGTQCRDYGVIVVRKRMKEYLLLILTCTRQHPATMPGHRLATSLRYNDDVTPPSSNGRIFLTYIRDRHTPLPRKF